MLGVAIGGGAAAVLDDPVKLKAAALLRGYRSARANSAISTALGATTLAAGAAAGAAGTGGGGAAFPTPTTVEIDALSSGFPVARGRSGGFGRFWDGGTVYGNRKGAPIIPNSAAPIPNGWAFEFRTNSPRVDLAVRNTGDGARGAQITVEVDGRTLPTVVLPAPGDGATYPVTLTTPSIRMRTYRVYCNALAEIQGIRTPQGFAVTPWWSIEPTGPQVLVGGDSYTWHPGTGTPRGSWAHQLGEGFGKQTDLIPAGVGGMGYVNAVEGKTAIDVVRALADLGVDPAAVVLAFGINDNGATAAALQAAVSTAWAEAAALFPGAPLVCMGPWTAPGRVMPDNLAGAIKAGFAAAVGTSKRAIYLDTFAPADRWQDTSVAANYQADGQHPTDAHARYLGLTRAAPALAASLQKL